MNLFLPKPGGSKLIFLMRVSLLNLIVALCTMQVLMARHAAGQGLEDINVTVELNNEDIKTLFKKIEKQSRLRFAYDPKLIRPYTNISLPGDTRSIKTTLDLALAGTPLRYRQVDNSVIIYTESGEDHSQANQQDTELAITVSGTVKDASTQQPLPGVNVIVKGTTNGTTTDSDGRYSLSVSEEDAVLIFSFIGYITQEVPVDGHTEINIALSEHITALDEVVVVAYGTQKKTSTTAAVSTLRFDEVKNVPVANLTNSLNGRLAGVIAAQNSGAPGRDGSEIHIRGIGTNGNSSPLIVVDGVIRSFSNLDPNSIESMTVLKDAAAVAPYGMAGANGVILVTTKRGNKGKPTLSYNGYVAYQNPTTLVDMVNAYDYVRLRNIADINSGQSPSFSAEEVEGYRKSSEGAADADYDKYPSTDAMEELLDKNTPMTAHNFSISGGSENTTYYIGMGYLYQRGLWSTANKRRYNLVANIEAKPTKTTTVGLSLKGWNDMIKRPGLEEDRAVFSKALAWWPINSFRYSNGLLANNNGRPTMLPLLTTGYSKSDETRINATLSVQQELSFIKGLSLKGAVSYDPNMYFAKTWKQPTPSTYNINTSVVPYVFTEVPNTARPSLSVSSDRFREFTYQGFLNYDKSFGKHNVTVLGVVEVGDIFHDYFSASRSNYQLYIDELNLGSSDPEDAGNGGSSSESTRIGYVYRFAYNYGEKYLFETSGRYDGHYFFAPGKKFGFFPAFSLGWRLSEESFIKDNISWIDYLKVRASWGKSGNLAGGPFQYSSAMGVRGNAYVLDGMVVQGAFERLESNPNITWEVANKSNVGLEFSLWDGLLDAEVDYFFEKRNNMLVSPGSLVPAEYGIGLAQQNAGIMENRGIDLSLGSYHTFANGIRLDLRANFTYAKNKLIETFENAVTLNDPNRRRTGRALNSRFGLKALGLFQESDDKNGDGLISKEDGFPTQTFGAISPGDIRYADINGDGKIDNSDETFLGYPILPQIVFGLNPRVSYRNFDLSVLLQGATQTTIPSLRGDLMWGFFNGANINQAVADDSWSPENPDARYPRLFGQGGNANNQQNSSFWNWDGSYLRVKHLEFGYNIPASLLSKINIESLRVYFSGQNLMTMSKLNAFIDPEMGQGGGNFNNSIGWYYPQQKVVSLGLNIVF